MLQTTTDSITELMELQSAAIYLLEGETLYLGATSPALPPQFPEEFRRAPLADRPHIREAITTGLPVFLPDTATVDLTPAERAVSDVRGLRSILYLPLLAEAKVIGALIVASVGEPRVISEAEIEVCLTLANLASLAVENAHLFESVQHHAANLEQQVAERIRTEVELLKSETRYRGIFEGVQDAIFMESPDGDILDINERACQIFGYSREEFLTKKIGDLVPPGKDALMFQKPGDDKLPDHPVETVNIRANGEEFPVEISGRMYNVGDEDVLLVVLRDITQRKKAEETIRQHASELERRVEERTIELTHANRAKDEFLANMSHELRTPLNSILGLSESLLEQRRGPLNEKQDQYVKVISSSGHHLLGLINDILDVSKIEAGKLDIRPDIISVKEVCESSLNLVKEMAAKKSISIKFSNEQSISTLYADPQRLKQVLLNLLNNAVKFTPEKGKVSLEVLTNTELGQIQFSITDNGIGIAHEDLKKLFTPFTQLDRDLSRQYEGTGLGLVIVYKLIALHGGSVHAESELGKGTRITVVLPWSENEIKDQDEDRKSSIPFEAVDEPESIPGDRGIILLAEDRESNVLTIHDYLTNYGYQVEVAQNGLEAIAMAEKLSPNIILMDIQMPELDGLEAIRRLRANSRFTSTPIIALTALAMPGDRERCLEAGANEYMSKPVGLKKLIQVLESFR